MNVLTLVYEKKSGGAQFNLTSLTCLYTNT